MTVHLHETTLAVGTWVQIREVNLVSGDVRKFKGRIVGYGRDFTSYLIYDPLRLGRGSSTIHVYPTDVVEHVWNVLVFNSNNR